MLILLFEIVIIDSMNNHGGKRIGSGRKKSGVSRKDQHAKSSAKWGKQVRIDTLKILGDKCVHCGYTDPRALQIDHKNGDGAKEFTRGYSYHLKVIESFKRNEDRYQLLCANCNWIKRCEKQEYRKFYTRKIIS